MNLPDEDRSKENSGDEADENVHNREEKRQGSLRYVPPEVRLKRLEQNENFKNYLQQRRAEGFSLQYEKAFKDMCGIKTHIEVDEYLRKVMKLRSQEWCEDVRYAEDTDGENGDDTGNGDDNGNGDVTGNGDKTGNGDDKGNDEDVESYFSEVFLNKRDTPYLQQLLLLKSALGNLLDPLWYYRDNVKYIMPQKTPEQYFPITVSNLSKALAKFNLVKAHLVYRVRDFMRPGFLAKLTPPHGFSYDVLDAGKKVAKKKKARPGVKTGKTGRTWKKRKQGRRCGKAYYERLLPKFTSGDLNDDVREWNRNATIMNKLTHRPCVRKPKYIRSSLKGAPTDKDPPYSQPGPEVFSGEGAQLKLFKGKSATCAESEARGTAAADFQWSEESDVDDEEEVDADDVQDVKRKARTNNLVKAIFEECVDEMKRRPMLSSEEDTDEDE